MDGTRIAIEWGGGGVRIYNKTIHFNVSSCELKVYNILYLEASYKAIICSHKL